MKRIGIVQLLDGILHINGLEDYFGKRDSEWKYVCWPSHLTDIGLMKILSDNMEEYCKTREQEGSCETHKESGDGKVPSFLQNRTVTNYKSARIKVDGSLDHWDFGKIRILCDDECRATISVEERVTLIKEWMSDCDYVVVDITGCMAHTPERSWAVIMGIAEAFGEDKARFFMYDYLNGCYFMNNRESAKWDEKLEALKKLCSMEIIPAEIIKKKLEDIGRTSMTETLKGLEKQYNNLLLEECMG